MHYDHKKIEKKWQARWEEEGVFHAQDDSDKEKFYCLIEFPFPSGAGLHIGHPRSYTALDVVARKKRMQGYNVLYPIGWDAFGLPTENYAIKTGRKPQDVTKENIDTFRRQLQSIGLSFDWSREVSTADPAYYKWTQWQFLEFFKAGLAYKDKMAINWCLSCKIGLANEEVVNGACERCGGEVEKRDKEQWMIAITKYADRLLEDLDTVDYLPKIKKQQQDWIGRSEGAEIDFAISGSDEVSIRVFTTRPDTLFGATYMVLAPEHPLVEQITNEDQQEVVRAYVKAAAKKSDIDRGDATKEKTGVFTGVYAINPVNNEKIPVWVADYAMMGYGTGAIMAVPAHDERDFAFAQKFDLPVRCVIDPGSLENVATLIKYASTGYTDEEALQNAEIKKEQFYKSILQGEECYPNKGTLINSDFLNGKSVEEAKEAMVAWLETEGKGKKAVSYKLRDWVFSRQRYWGEPIPLVHCESCSPETDGWVPVPEDQLPVVLPEIDAYEPTDTGESPLAAVSDWVNTECPQCGGPATRETDTMPNWAGSSWYFLRYIDPHNENAFADQEKLKYWMPVDLYNGGMEHTTLHLLYSRFWNKFLFDRGHVPVSEPYDRRHSHGLILAEDGRKMSKSLGNVVNPDEIVNEYGADTLRVYEMFIGPFEEPVPWSTNGMIGVRRFLDKVARYPELIAEQEPENVTKALHKTIKKVTEDIDGFRFNTAVAQMMTFANEVSGARAVTKQTLMMFARVLCPFAPHVANELAEQLGHDGVLEAETWPEYDPELIKDTVVTMAVQVNGKLRGTIEVAPDISQQEAEDLARTDENITKYLEGDVKKVIFIPGRLLNFVVSSTD